MSFQNIKNPSKQCLHYRANRERLLPGIKERHRKAYREARGGNVRAWVPLAPGETHKDRARIKNESTPPGRTGAPSTAPTRPSVEPA